MTLRHQTVLILTTLKPSMRDEVIAWHNEDGYEAMLSVHKRSGVLKERELLNTPVGLLASNQEIVAYPSVVHALADEWRLMAPPVKVEDHYQWWMTM